MIKLVLLTGFLGAGKTTMLREGLQMAELSNGSIFCACIKDKFVDSLIEMSYKDLDYLFIEASGLADPASMVSILEGIKNSLLNEYQYKGSVCIVDGESFVNLYELLPAIKSQLEFCGSVVINKGDRIDEEQLEEILAIIQKVNPEAAPFVTSYCRVNAKELVEGTRLRDIGERESSNTYESRPTTFVLKGLKQLPYEKLQAFLEQIAGSTYRIKGFADTDRGDIEISAVGNNLYLNEWKQPVEHTEIVVISSIGFKMMSILTNAIDTHLKGYIRI